jgi:hypothetical protein
MKADIRQSPKQSYDGKSQESSASVFDPVFYHKKIMDEFPGCRIFKFHEAPDKQENLEYLIAEDEEDLSRDAVLSLLTTPEERAYRFLDSMKRVLFHNFEMNPSFRIFLKHTLQSRLGTHCIFGLQYQGFEIDEHSFVVHVDNNNRVVMLSCTYLPRLPEMLMNKKPGEIRSVSENEIKEEEEKIRAEIEMIGEYDRSDGEKLWLIIWDEQLSKFQVAPGNQVKLSLSEGLSRKSEPPNVLRIPAKMDIKIQEINNAPGLTDEKVGLGEIVRDFLEMENNDLSTLDDDHIKKYEGILEDLDSNAELIGKYAAIKDQINGYVRDKKKIFINESQSAFDRVTAYYHLDYIQRYFREKLGFRLLDNYPHLNPVQITLSPKSDTVAWYDVNGEKIMFYQLRSTGFTAVRDPRLVYHEFVHVVTDAIARLHRAGQLLTPRSKEALQAQAMDEGIADYFASSLAERQGAKKALAYYLTSGKWDIKRDLDPGNVAREPKPIKMDELNNRTKWNKKKYELGELWGRYLWQVRKSLGGEIADILISYSVFFLTRWATFKQGVQAILLADRLLFGGLHKEAIEMPKEAIEKIKFI